MAIQHVRVAKRLGFGERAKRVIGIDSKQILNRGVRFLIAFQFSKCDCEHHVVERVVRIDVARCLGGGDCVLSSIHQQVGPTQTARIPGWINRTQPHGFVEKHDHVMRSVTEHRDIGGDTHNKGIVRAEQHSLLRQVVGAVVFS